MIRSFAKLQQVNPGFNVDRLLTMRLTPSFSRYTTNAQIVTPAHTMQRIGGIRAIQSVALASNFPFNPGRVVSEPSTTPFEIEGRRTSARVS